MEYIVLASGSKGNACLIKGEKEYLLIDYGISKTEFDSKLEQLKINHQDIVGVLFTHAHPDHLKSDRNTKNCFDISKIYCSRGVVEVPEQNYLDPIMALIIGEFKIMTLPLSHDSPCLGFLILNNNEKLAYITDTGYVNSKLFQMLNNCDHYLLESNYDEGMLLSSNRSNHLKRRIISPRGHLSNEESANVLKENIGNNTKSICLMHISRECNTKELALSTVKTILKESNIAIDNIDINASDQYEIYHSKNYAIKA